MSCFKVHPNTNNMSIIPSNMMEQYNSNASDRPVPLTPLQLQSIQLFHAHQFLSCEKLSLLELSQLKSNQQQQQQLPQHQQKQKQGITPKRNRKKNVGGLIDGLSGS